MKPELDRIARFGVVGVLATLVHALILGILTSTGLPAAWANAFAFILALGVTYTGQRFWVFGVPPHHVRFCVVAMLGLAIHGAGMPVLLAVGLGLWPAWLVLTVLAPIATFLAARLWAFAPA